MIELFRRGLSTWWSSLALAVVASVSFAILFGYASYDVDGLRIGLGVAPSHRGETELVIPPFGEITAFTHKTPLKLKVVLERIYPHEISQVANGFGDQNELVQKLETEGKNAFRQFIIRLVMLSALGGAIGAAISPRRRLIKASVGALIGAVLIGSILVGTYRTFDVHAFKQPRYSGALSAAPWATEAISERLGDVKAFRQEIRSIAKNVSLFYSKVDSWQPINEDTVKILHVSDIHNNPAAIDLVKRVVVDFDIDMIIDTGDITDFGTPLETKLLEGIADLRVPYAFVPGNHDSPDTIAFLKGVENVTVLEGEQVDIKGITILGIPDPSSTTSDPKPADDKVMADLGAGIARKYDSLERKPLILAVHDPRAVKNLTGRVPIILVGHIHKASLKEMDGHIVSNAGTTGGAGIRTFQASKGVPYTLNILHVERSSQRTVAVDSLTVMGAEREFRLERNLIEGDKDAGRELEKANRE